MPGGWGALPRSVGVPHSFGASLARLQLSYWTISFQDPFLWNTERLALPRRGRIGLAGNGPGRDELIYHEPPSLLDF